LQARRTLNARAGLELLRRNGVLFIAAEGGAAENQLTLPFYGRMLPLPYGPAELAMHSRSPVVALFSGMSIDGRITLELVPLVAPNYELESDEMVRSYAAMLTERWPKLLPTMHWGRLNYILSLPHTG
jgi:lauroyl/myristoyl acyltransferase